MLILHTKIGLSSFQFPLQGRKLFTNIILLPKTKIKIINIYLWNEKCSLESFKWDTEYHSVHWTDENYNWFDIFKFESDPAIFVKLTVSIHSVHKWMVHHAEIRISPSVVIPFLNWYLLFIFKAFERIPSDHFHEKLVQKKKKQNSETNQNKHLDNFKTKERSPWTNIDRAAPREAFGLSIASGCPFGSPTLGTHVPKGIEPIGSWRIGKEPDECLKCLHIPEN